MLETILTILICYVLGVSFYTYVVRNDAMHKYAPDVNIKAIVKEGAIGMAIGFAIVAGIYYAIGFINYLRFAI